MARSLLTIRNTKLLKSRKLGWLTCGITLAPAHEAAITLKAQLPTTCAHAANCAKLCLSNTGRNTVPQNIRVRAERTLLWYTDRRRFVNQLRAELEAVNAKAQREGLRLAIRPNLLSDLHELARTVQAVAPPHAVIYDYTKIPSYWWVNDGIHRTASYDETWTPTRLQTTLLHAPVAVVFSGIPPRSWRGHRVIDGDEHDLRFHNKPGQIVGLRFKGSKANRTKAIKSGFCIDA